jgi:hypothetical protein
MTFFWLAIHLLFRLVILQVILDKNPVNSKPVSISSEEASEWVSKVCCYFKNIMHRPLWEGD